MCAAGGLNKFYATVIDKKEGVCGVVLDIQAFGDYTKWHPYIHSLVADGLFLFSGSFHVIPRSSVRPAAEKFRTNVLKLLKKEELIDEDFIKMIMKQRGKPPIKMTGKSRAIW